MSKAFTLLGLAICLAISNVLHAAEKTVGDYTIHATVFNSSFITPEIASIYDLTRGKNRALVNVAVTSKNSPTGVYGLSAEVSGGARNLMQQLTQLEFIKVDEPNAVYYLAPFKFSHEEILRFKIEVTLPNGIRDTLEFQKKLHVDGR